MFCLNVRVVRVFANYFLNSNVKLFRRSNKHVRTSNATCVIRTGGGWSSETEKEDPLVSEIKRRKSPVGISFKSKALNVIPISTASTFIHLI